MSVTARTWVEGEIATAAKLNTIRDDLLALDLIAGIKSVQYGTISMSNGVTTNTATITAITTTKTVLLHLGQTIEAGSAISDGLARLALTNSTTVTASRSGSANVCGVGFCAMEYK